jgi:two-component system sensor histidine kinase/response regulator
MNWHRLLNRQMKRCQVDPDESPALRELLEKINQAYLEFDEERYRQRRSLEISSQEMRDLNGQLTAEKAKLDAILANLGEGVVALDENHQVVFANEAAHALLGVPSLGQNFWDLVGMSVPACGVDEATFTTASGRTFASAYTFCYLSIPLPPVHFVLVFRDITLKRQILADLRQAQQDAEAASRAKSEFLAQMSHEIRTPMNGVLGMASLMAQTKLAEEQRHYLSVIQASADALLSVINDILDFSKVEAGKLELVDDRFDVRDVVESVCALLAEKAHSKGLELVHLVYRNIPNRVVGDADRLRQVLTNLVGNAVKFTHQGEIVVRAKSQKQTVDSIELRFEVSDSGIGMSQEVCSKVFEPFTQAESQMTRRYGGTGLGLPISQRLVEMMGGKIWVESQPDQGSTFYFTVALSLETQPPLEEAKAGLDLFGLRVLIIDDNETNRQILVEQLQSWDFAPKAVPSGEEGLQLLRLAQERGIRFDLVLLDMQMPDMDGLEVIRRIRAQSALTSLPIIVLTSVGHRDWLEEAHQLGVRLHHDKPIRMQALRELIQKAIQPEPAPQPETPLPNQATPARLQGNVLLVEDSAFNQQVALGLLEHLGLNCVLAEDGLEAVEAFWSSSFDLVLMDCQMPGMDGYEATAEIRRRETGNKRTVIIAMTAHVLPGDREKCLAAGMDDYLSKPITLEKLSGCLSRWLPQEVAPKATVAPASPTPVGDALVDAATWETIWQLCLQQRSRGQEDVASLFVKEVESYLIQLQGLHLNHEKFAIRKILHTLRGCSENLGARRLALRCSEVSKAIKERPEELGEDWVSGLRNEFQLILDFLGQEMKDRLASEIS